MTLKKISKNRYTSAIMLRPVFAITAAGVAVLLGVAIGCSGSKEPQSTVNGGVSAVESPEVVTEDSSQSASVPSSPLGPENDVDSTASDATADTDADANTNQASSSGLKLPETSDDSEKASNGLILPADIPKPADLAEDLPAYDVTNPLEDAARKAFSAPADMTRLSLESNLWIDPKKKRLVVDGYIAVNQGPLEMFACPVGTKEHESIVSVLARAREVHAGLLAIGADSGTPVSFNPEYRPATGQRIAIWAMWRDADGVPQKIKAQQWVKDLREDKPLELDWVFAGSSFWKDPESGREYYQADSGDLVCVSNFTTATLDLPIESSQSNASLTYVANAEQIPPQGTPVRLVLLPIPFVGSQVDPEAADPSAPPEDQLLTLEASQ